MSDWLTPNPPHIAEPLSTSKKSKHMSYDLKIYRNEVRENSNSLDFLENEETILPFSDEQNEILRKRLQHYKYQLESKNDLFEEYNYDGGKWGISAILTNNCLNLKCSGGNQDGLFEILQTASEFCDGDLAVLNLQDGTWENGGETYKIGEDSKELSKKESKKTESKIQNEIKQTYKSNNKRKPWWKIW